jgi:chorismate-pyruvate lyase
MKNLSNPIRLRNAGSRPLGSTLLSVDPSMRRAVLAWRQARADLALGRLADSLAPVHLSRVSGA